MPTEIANDIIEITFSNLFFLTNPIINRTIANKNIVKFLFIIPTDFFTSLIHTLVSP